jgi:hypothetical protein
MEAAGYSESEERETPFRVAMLASRLDDGEQTKVEDYIKRLIARRTR